MPNFSLAGTEFYDAPKNAGTTIRMWLKHYEAELPDFSNRKDYYNLSGLGLPRLWQNNVVQEPQFFSYGFPDATHWCIKRDPIDRFISAYTDKVLHEKRVDWSADTCISMLATGEMERIARADSPDKSAACHFLSQTHWFGQEIGYYEHVFDISQMDQVKVFCEDVVFKMKLPIIHARQQALSGIKKLRLSPLQHTQLEEIYVDDYNAGWY